MSTLLLTFLLLISSSYSITPFRCEKLDDLKLFLNEKINMQIRCSQQIGTIEITPKLPKGLELIEDRIVGLLKERCENNLYKVHIISAKTPDSYDVEFAVSSLNVISKKVKEGDDVPPVFISLSDYWYVYQSVDTPPVENWNLNIFNPMLHPYVWVYTSPNNLPSSIGDATIYYRNTFELTFDLNNLEQFLIKITANTSFALYLNGFKVYARGIGIENAGVFNQYADEEISVENYELYAPKELFINGNNTVAIVLHSTRSSLSVDKTVYVEVSGILGNNNEAVTQTMVNELSSTGMNITLEKNGKTKDPSLIRLIDGNKVKFGLEGTAGDESSLFPNTITCNFHNKAKYINQVYFITVTNNYVFPKSYIIQATMRMREETEKIVWEDLYEHTQENPSNLGWESVKTYPLNNPNHHFYEGYRIIIYENFAYNIAYGNYLEIGEFTVQYKRMDKCVSDDYSDSVSGSYGVKVCPEGEFGGTIKRCRDDGFYPEVEEHCKPMKISEFSYGNENKLTFFIGLKNVFIPFYEGLAESFTIDCGESIIANNIKINKFGVIYGNTEAEEVDLECTVSYVGALAEDTGSLVVTITSEISYCDDGIFPKTEAGQTLAVHDCSSYSDIYKNVAGEYVCSTNYIPPIWVPNARCTYITPTITYPESEYQFVALQEIEPIEPITEHYHSNISISGEFPGGLIFDSNTGVISGTPEAIYEEYKFNVIIENLDGKNTFPLTITIVQKVTEELEYEDMELITGIEFKSNPPAIQPETVIGSCSIDPELPQGLTLNCRTGIISGTNTDQLDGYEAQHTVSNTATSATFNLKITAKYCAEDGGFAVTFPGKTGTKPCSTLGEEGKEYGDITRVCKITDKTTYDVEWEDPSNSGCHEAYPRSFTVDESTLIGVTKAAKAVKLIVDPPSNYKITLDPPPPSSTIAAGNTIMFPSGSSYMETASVTVVGDVNLTMTYDFKIYAPVCEGDGFPRTQVGGTATKKCALPKYGTVIGTCKESDPPPYKFTEDDSGCHDAYPTNVEWNIPDKLYVAFALEIRPVVSNPPDTISFEWKDNKSPGGLRLDGKTGVIIGVPTEDTQNSPEFTVIVHGDTDTEYKLVINVIQLRCEATDTYPEVNAGEIAQGKCQQGEEGFKSAKCIITSSGGNYIAEFTPLDSHCEAARPSFTYTPQEKGYRLGKDEINLIPEYDANIFPLLTWTFENLPDGVSGNPTDGSIKGIPTSTNPIDNIQIIGITASTGNKESDPFPLMVYIADDYRCVAKGIYPTSVKGSKFDSPCLDGKIGNQRIECLSGGIWSDLLTTNCTNPIIHNEENNLTVVFKFTAKNVTIDDLLMEDIEGLRQGICAVLGIKDNCKNRVQVVAVKSNGRRRILVDESVEFNAYIVTDKETVTQARVEENLPNFQAKKTFSDKYKATLGNRLTSSKLSSVLNEIEAPIQQVVVPKPPEAKKEGLDDTTMYIIIGVAAAVGVLIILVVCCLICYCRRVKSSHGGASKAPVKKRGTKV